MQDGEPATSVDASLYIAFIALLGLAGAGVAHGLSRPGSARVGQRRLRLLARAGATLLLLGVGIGVGRWIAAGGIGDDGAAGVVITGYFLLGGALFAALSRRPDIFRASRARRIRISMSDRCAR